MKTKDILTALAAFEERLEPINSIEFEPLIRAARERLKLPESITFIIRKWWNKRNGWSRQTVQIVIDGVNQIRVVGDNGDACAWLEEKGIIPPRRKFPSGAKESPYYHIESLGINLLSITIDVQRRKEL